MILFLILLALSGIYFIVQSLRARKHVLVKSILELVLVSVIVWYFVPTTLPLNESASVTSVSLDNGSVVPDSTQQARLMELLDELSLQRRFFNGYASRGSVPAAQYVYISISDGDKHIGLHLNLQDTATCYTEQGHRILNAEALCMYIKSAFL